MTETYVRFAILGLATGSLYAMVALGVVIVRRASGVLNFSAGAVGAFSAFVTYDLRDAHGVPVALAVTAGILTGATLGILTQILVMRVLASASSLTRLIATLGVMTTVQGLTLVVFGPEDRGTPSSLLPDDRFNLFGSIPMTKDRLILLGIALVLAAALAALYARTRFGLATTAVAESRVVASSYGLSPQKVELANFALGGALSALAAILIAPIVGLTQAALVLVIIPALASALVGRFSSFGLTIMGALLIGALQAVIPVVPAVADHPDYLSGLPQAVPLLIIIVMTAARGRSRPERGEMSSRLPLPGTGRIRPAVIVLGALAGVIALTFSDGSYAGALATTFATAILLLSVIVVTGYAGQLSLAQFALAGFGAWVAARFYATQGLPFLAVLAIAIVLTVPLGLVVALPALRARGVDLAVCTLGLALMIQALVFNSAKLTGGFGGTPVTNPTVFGWRIDGNAHPQRYAFVCLVCLVFASLMVANLRRGRSGRRLLAVRGNERAAASIGVSVYQAKLYAFAVSGALAALSGVLIAFRAPYVDFQQFGVFGSITAVEFATVGGIGWVGGALLGAVLAPFALLQQVFQSAFGFNSFADYSYLIAGVAVILLVAVAPDGLAQRLGWLTSRLRVPLLWSVPGPRWSSSTPPRGRRGGTMDIRDLTVRFGGVVALNDVSLEVRPGQVLGVIGPNGAGKTTLLDTITGFTSARHGEISLNGHSIKRWSPERRARAGLGRSFQAVELFGELTVRENLLVAADRQRRGTYLSDLVHPGRPRSSEVIDAVVEEFGLGGVLECRPTELSQSQARLVGIARAVCTEPSVLFLDEPAAGLDQEERRELEQVIRELADKRGLAVILVEHDVSLVAAVCDSIMVVDFGTRIALGAPNDVLNDPAVTEAYIGSSDETPAPARGHVKRGAGTHV